VKVKRRGKWAPEEEEALHARAARMMAKIHARGGAFSPGDMGVRVEARVIPSADPREGLRGSRGLFAAGPIRRGELIGPYAGRMTTEKEYQEKHPRILQVFMRDSYSYRFSAKSAHPWKRLGPQVAESLGHTFTSDVDKLGEDWTSDATKFSDDNLMIDAYSDGCALMFANDFRPDPFNHLCAPGARDGAGPCPNADFMEVDHKGWPHLVIVATEDIPPGGEVPNPLSLSRLKVPDTTHVNAGHSRGQIGHA
jgi:hypothetical protein